MAFSVVCLEPMVSVSHLELSRRRRSGVPRDLWSGATDGKSTGAMRISPVVASTISMRVSAAGAATSRWSSTTAKPPRQPWMVGSMELMSMKPISPEPALYVSTPGAASGSAYTTSGQAISQVLPLFIAVFFGHSDPRAV